MSTEDTSKPAPAGDQLNGATSARAARTPHALVPAAPPVLNRGAANAPMPEPVARAAQPASGAQVPRPPPFVARAARPELARAEDLRQRLAAHGEALRSGAAFDQSAVDAVLGEADQALAALGELASALPPGEREGALTARAGLLDAAFALTAAVQQLVPGADRRAAGPQVRPPPAPKPQAPGNTFEPAAPQVARRGRLLWWFAALSLLAAVGYHGNVWLQRQEALQALPQAPLPGIPEGLNAVRQPNGKVVLMLQAGRHVDREQLDQFKAAQAGRGWKLTELGPGAWVVEPDPARGRP